MVPNPISSMRLGTEYGDKPLPNGRSVLRDGFGVVADCQVLIDSPLLIDRALLLPGKSMCWKRSLAIMPL